jgi:glutamate formiminotransferase
VGALEGVERAYLLDVSSDPDHHRTVVTFVGPSEGVLEGALAIFAEAVTKIDLNFHQGIHPRIGAVDVVPFIPLLGVTMKECVELARRFAERIAELYAVSSFLYGEAARVPTRQNLANIRRGQFEGLSTLIREDPLRAPDFGPQVIHPTAGACAVGARDILIAYNIYLDTPEKDVAQKVAKAVRESDGGMLYLKALGLFIQSRGKAQVSMNLTDFRKTSLYQVFERVNQEALRHDSRITSSEIVGLVPREALEAGDYHMLSIEGFSPSSILEERVFQATGIRC